jgi:oxygen-independent coproporphyrinogen-3 oxidase
MQSSQESFSLYIHVPFCVHKCSYCDFYSCSGIAHEHKERVFKRILTETQALLQTKKGRLTTVYIGGGTPSFAPRWFLQDILALVRAYNPIELTVECNPENVSDSLLQTLGIADDPFMRLSVGIQSFNVQALASVGRRVSLSAMNLSLELLKPFAQCVNFDLIAGLPQQSFTDLHYDVERLTAWHPAHISLYALTVELGTALAKQTFLLAPATQREEMWQQARQQLYMAGYYAYEISNYTCNPAYESKHNKNYWDLNPYCGVGPGAVGTWPQKDGSAVRINGKKDLDAWANSNTGLYEEERVSRSDFMFEHYMMGLRTQQGVSKQWLEQRFGVEALLPWQQLKQYSQYHPIMHESTTHLWLSDEGRLFLDQFLVDLLCAWDI